MIRLEEPARKRLRRNTPGKGGVEIDSLKSDTAVKPSLEGSYSPKEPSLAETRSRRKGIQATKCPVCLKTLYRSRMSIVDINNHINRCSDAQFRIKMPKVRPELTKLKLDKKGNVITRENASGESARAEKLEVLKSGTMKEAFQDLLMKHLDS